MDPPPGPITSFYDLMVAIRNSSDQLTEEEIERHRDIAEGNIQAELNAIRDLAQTLDSLCTDDERVREVVAQIRNHVDVIQQSTDRVSSQAEVYGAVQQVRALGGPPLFVDFEEHLYRLSTDFPLKEERMSRAFEVMVAHVENLKRASEREHRELEEARKLLLDHQLMHDVANATPAKDSRGRLFSIPGGSAGSSSAPGPVRALRALNLGARRCSLPVPQAVLLPTAHEADAARAAIDATASCKSECHVEEDIVGSAAKADGSHHHGATNGDVGVSSLSAHEHSGHITEESSALQNGVLEELVAASVQDTLELSERLNGVDSMDADELRARVEEDEERDREGDGEERDGDDRADAANIDLLHWAANVVVRVKYWLNRSRQVLAGRKRLAPVTVQRFTTARYFLSGLLVTAALVTALVVLLPGVAPSSAARHDVANMIELWRDLCRWGPDIVTLRHGDRPPPT
ncbi:hypothetical protein HPB50_022189 [Hyalomma asiaticum]|uniref:Uncharacterized protein n=1 Tax=Hyalomma asiaticum TaxID=266040 RepID=A0ACB7RQC3_HYAAI|nr:hypothetical protein HPB50_022189 [Hyalomma asiaticum]